MNEPISKGPRFYFPLLRVIAMLRGGDTRRAESNAVEAWLVGLMTYAIHYLFFARLLFSSGLQPWPTGLLLVALAFWIWLFWLLLLYLNSLIIKLLRTGGLARGIPIRHVQSVLWVTCTSAMAFALLKGSPAVREVSAVWLVAVGMNLVAAVVLAFSDAARSPGE
jgi:hypothetical protein